MTKGMLASSLGAGVLLVLESGSLALTSWFIRLCCLLMMFTRGGAGGGQGDSGGFCGVGCAVMDKDGLPDVATDSLGLPLDVGKGGAAGIS